MSMTHEAFAAWLEKYGRAWEARNAQAVAELYEEDGTYQVTPFVEPMCGRAAILEYWDHVAQTEENLGGNGGARNGSMVGFVCDRTPTAQNQARRSLRYCLG